MNDEGRSRAIAWARSVMDDPLTVFLDTETTGLGPTAEIIDIAVVSLNGSVMLDTLVKPRRPIPPEATAVHGISYDDIADAPTWWEAWHWASEVIVDRRVVIYNAEFDIGVIDQCCRPDDMIGFESRWECAMKAYSDFDGTPGKYPGSKKWWKLDLAAERFGVNPGGHRALADSEACRQVVLAMSRAEIEADAIPKQPTLACW